MEEIHNSFLDVNQTDIEYEEYYLKDVALQTAQFPNNFANKSD